MNEMIQIFWDVLCPIFLIIIVGFFIQKKFSLNLNALTKVQIYVLIPALIFIKISTSQLEGDLVLQIILFTIILFVLLMFISWITSRLIKLDRKTEKRL